jgi:NAD(P)H-flavin reductase/ferredoxin/truncated hemoglobin YjbI
MNSICIISPLPTGWFVEKTHGFEQPHEASSTFSEVFMPKVTFEGADYEVRAHETVLDALVRGGAQVNFSCRKGSCQTCLLRGVNRAPESEGQRGLRQELRETGHFLPCITHVQSDLHIERPDLSTLNVNAYVVAKDALAANVTRLLIEPEINLSWRPGQYVELIREDGLSRPYSIASIGDEDYFIELHVRRFEDGQMSSWIAEELAPGERVALRGPLGDCVYDPSFAMRPLIVVATSTGAAPLCALVRDAIRSGHARDISFYFGARTLEGLYLDETLRQLSALHPKLHYVPCVSGDEAFPPDREDLRRGRASAIAFEDMSDANGHVVYLCGNPEMVYDARCRAVLAGVLRADILADPFETHAPIIPRDLEKLAAIEPDLELWQALDDGAKLRTVLEDFYRIVYDDPRLSPYFHNVTMDRAIAQQYTFLRDIFTGARDFLGVRPFNAHHWMIISDELFDYREALFESCLRRHGVSETHLRRWAALHELFRREIVKSKERGVIMGGKEYLHEGYSLETLAIGSLCDGCFQEMPEGTQGRMHRRTGKLFCMACNATDAVDQFGLTKA